MFLQFKKVPIFYQITNVFFLNTEAHIHHYFAYVLIFNSNLLIEN